MRYTTLISAPELLAIADSDETVIVDCRFALADPMAGEAEYRAGHIPGAIYAHLDRHLSSPITPTSGRHPLPDPEQLARQLGQWGIDRGKQVVAYDDSGGAFASRFWWLARWLGLTDTSVLNGGLTAWRAAGYPISTDIPEPTPTEFAADVDDTMWIGSDDLAQALDAGEVLLVDAREPERYRGETEPIDPVTGHVPGAVNLAFKENLDSSGAYLPAAELRARFAPILDDHPPAEMVHMCGSGVTACVNLLAAEHAGLTGGKLYAGSWSEWIRSAERPVATGH